jgi:hypothetical protein
VGGSNRRLDKIVIDELLNLNSLPAIIRINKSNRVR